MPPSFIPAAHFHFLTPCYEALMWPFTRRTWKRIAQEAAQRAPQGSHVIDVGGGPGTVLRALRRLRPDLHLTTTDVDPRMIEIATRKASDLSIECRVASMDALPFPDQSVDLAISSLAFHHVSREVQGKAYLEVKRILKAGGVFLLCDFSVPTNKRWWMSLKWWKYIEPSIGPQLEGQLFDLAKETGASIETLQTFYDCISLHLVRFASAGKPLREEESVAERSCIEKNTYVRFSMCLLLPTASF